MTDQDTPQERRVVEEVAEDEATEAQDREVADWLKTMGPEDLDRETVMDNLEAYGFDLMEDEKLSLPSADNPPGYISGIENDVDVDEVGENLEETAAADGDFRPVEDAVSDALDKDTPAS